MLNGRMKNGVAAGFFAALGSVLPAAAQDDGLARCAAIADDAARLTCFDELTRTKQVQPVAVRPAPPATTAASPSPSPAEPPPLAVSPPAPAKAAVVETPPAATAAQAETEFGFSDAELRKQDPQAEKRLERVTSIVDSIEPYGAGYFIITMQDGAVWQVTEARSMFRPPRAGDEVVVRRASLGSYLLDVGRQPSMRVKRIR